MSLSANSASFLALLSTAAVALAISAIGCAAPTTDEAAASESALTRAALVTPGEFKLYATPRANPTPQCDVHTALSLDRANAEGAQATLAEVVGGTCEIYVERQPRAYELRLEDTSCGSNVFTGTSLVNDKLRTITITDHRTRVCRDLVPARIIVEETDDSGAVQTRYSLD